jgi:hypothetical protein
MCVTDGDVFGAVPEQVLNVLMLEVADGEDLKTRRDRA